MEVHWYLTTTNIILAGQKEVVEGAIRLLDRPWWYAISKAWVIFAWNCWTGKRRMKKEYAR